MWRDTKCIGSDSKGFGNKGTHKLVGALRELKVAAADTCTFLITAGLVAVNGTVL